MLRSTLSYIRTDCLLSLKNGWWISASQSIGRGGKRTISACQHNMASAEASGINDGPQWDHNKPWKCRFCKEEDKEVERCLHHLLNCNEPFDWNMKFSNPATSKKKKLLEAMKDHAKAKRHLIGWNFSLDHPELASSDDSDIIAKLGDYHLRLSPEDFSYFHFVEHAVPLVFQIAKADLLSYIWLRGGHVYASLHGAGATYTKGLKHTRGELEAQTSNKPLQASGDLKEEIWKYIHGHLKAMCSAIEANWESTNCNCTKNISDAEKAELYQGIQDVFYGNHYKESPVYLVQEEEEG